MSFFPLLSVPGFEGFTTIHATPPNFWEFPFYPSKYYLYILWSSDSIWHAYFYSELSLGDSVSISESDLPLSICSDSSVFLTLTTTHLPSHSFCLPNPRIYNYSVPAWRATIGLRTKYASTSYQGELFAFPPSSTLLSFSPFFQVSPDYRNYLLFLNLEDSPVRRVGSLAFFSASRLTHYSTINISSNHFTLIPLDQLPLDPNDLLVSASSTMSGIPLYLTHHINGTSLSLEHTHPPASYFLDSHRFVHQKSMKKAWFSMLYDQ